jgi:hypothetical protein
VATNQIIARINSNGTLFNAHDILLASGFCAKDFCNALTEIIVVDDNTANAINPNIR